MPHNVKLTHDRDLQGHKEGLQGDCEDTGPTVRRRAHGRKMLSRTTATLVSLCVSVLSSHCSLYNGVANDDKYMKGSSVREYIRGSLRSAAYYDGRDATSTAYSAAERAYFQHQLLLDLVMADMMAIDDSAYYRKKDVSDCGTRISSTALYVDSLLGLFVCNLKPVSQI